MTMLVLFGLLIARVLTFFALFLLAVLVASLLVPRQMLGPIVTFFRYYRPRLKRMYKEILAEQAEAGGAQARELAKRQDDRRRETIALGRLVRPLVRFLWEALVAAPLEWVSSQLLRLVAWEEKELEPYDRFFG